MNKKLPFFLSLIALSLSLSSCGEITPKNNNSNKETETASKIDDNQPIKIEGLSFEDKTVVYNGTFQSIYVTGVPSDVQVMYEGNEQINVGEYQVIARFEVDKTKYIKPEEMRATLKITKATFDASRIGFASKSFTYDGNVHSLEANGFPTNDFAVSYTNNDQINAGEYEVTAHFDCISGNYNDIQDLKATLTIDKARYNYDIGFLGDSFVYDGEPHSLQIFGYLPDGVSVSYTNNNQTEPGTYEVTAHFESTGNYVAPEDKTAYLTINKAMFNPNLGVQSFVYDGEPHSMVPGVTVPDGVTVTYENNVQTEPGVYEVTAKVKGDDHYMDGQYTGKLIIDNSNVASNGLLFYEDSFNGYAGVSGIGTCTDKDIVIPAIYNNLPVTRIFSSVFQNNDFVESVTMPNTITDVDQSMFRGCKKLKTIKFSDSIAYLPAYIVSECPEIETLDLPKNVTSSGGTIASGCPKLKTVCFHDGFVFNNRYSQFEQCPAIETYVIDENSKDFAIEDGILYNKDKTVLYSCPAAKTGSVTISNGVTEVFPFAFKDAKVHTVNLPNSITKLGKGAFWMCDNLSLVNIPAGANELPDSLFYRCSSLQSINIPSTVTKIGYNTFGWCYALKRVSITDSVVSIENEAFENGDDLYYHGSTANWINNVSAIAKYFTNVHLYLDGSNYEPTAIVVPDDIETIPEYAFSGIKTIKSITLPNSVTSIGEYAFCKCYSLESLTCDAALKTIDSYAFNRCYSLKTVAFNDGLETIGFGAFSECYALESVSIPNSVTSLGKHAFSHNRSLRTATIGNGITSIPEYVFSDCSSLNNVEIRGEVTTIEFGAFSKCYSLSRFIVPSTVTEIQEYAFEDCQRLKEIVNESGLDIEKGQRDNGDIARYADFVLSNLDSTKLVVDENGFVKYSDGSDVILVGYNGTSKNIVIPNDVTKIASYAFANSQITRVNIQGNVKEIGDYAFASCNQLYQVIIGSGVQSCTTYAFIWCSNLVEVINKSTDVNVFVTTRGNAGTYTKYLTNSESNSRISVDENGFATYSDGSDIWLVGYEGEQKDIVIPSGITKIYDGMFQDDYLIQSVVIPNGVTELGTFVLFNCPNLRRVSLPDTLTTAGNSCFLYDDLLENTNYHGAHYLGNDTNKYVFLYSLDYDENDMNYTYKVYICEGTKVVANFENIYKVAEIINESSLTITKGEGIAKYALGVANNENDSHLYQYADGYVMYANGDDYILVDCNDYNEPFEIPLGTTAINAYALCRSRCRIEGFVIPNSVTSIGEYAFSQKNIGYVIFGSGVSTIKKGTFLYSNLSYIVLNKSITIVEEDAFRSTGLQTIYYTGNESEFSAINVSDFNDDFKSATVYYYSETAPESAGNYWHYVEGIPTAW